MENKERKKRKEKKEIYTSKYKQTLGKTNT